MRPMKMQFKRELLEDRDDLEKLQQQLWDAGYDVSLGSIWDAWEAYSGSMCAQWMCLEDDHASNVRNILFYLEEGGDD